jgi:hypothetical protein
MRRHIQTGHYRVIGSPVSNSIQTPSVNERMLHQSSHHLR